MQTSVPLAADDPAALAAFYARLGVHLDWRRSGRAGQRANYGLVLVAIGAPDEVPAAMRRRLALLVNALDEALAVNAAHGGRTLLLPVECDGRPTALIEDPAGNVVALFDRPR